MKAELYDPRRCELGEGVFWHPERAQLFWFDIIGRKLLSRVGDEPLEWAFDEHVSAAGWLDRDTLLIATETGLSRFAIERDECERLVALEANRAQTRSNDGRADPQGGFWIGTMGKQAEPHAGAIHRFYRGELRCLYDRITIPNAICFSPDGGTAYFTDTPTRRIMRVALDADGWPAGEPATFIDLRGEGLNPDGAVVDAAGGLWNAQWGAGRVARYVDGALDRVVTTAGIHASCPAFGGRKLDTLYVSTACEGIDEPDAAQGRLYAATLDVAGQAEHRVVL